NTDLGGNLYYARRYDEAIAQLRKTMEMDPRFYITHIVLAQALDAKGDRDAAIGEWQKARALNDDPALLGLLGRAYGLSGNKEEALRWLEQSYQDRAGSDIGYIRVDRLLDPLRGDPRFEALAEKIVPAAQFGNKATAKP